MDDLAVARDLISTLRDRGVSFVLEGERKLRVKPWRSLPAEDRADVKRHRDGILAALRAEQMPVPVAPPPPPPPPPDPVVRVNGRRITELDVRRALLALGDEEFARYESGDMSKAEAYEIAALRERQFRELCR